MVAFEDQSGRDGHAGLCKEWLGMEEKIKCSMFALTAASARARPMEVSEPQNVVLMNASWAPWKRDRIKEWLTPEAVPSPRGGEAAAPAVLLAASLGLV